MHNTPQPAVSVERAWLVGGGIASLAAAVYLIRDAGLPGHAVHILEESAVIGGALDGSHTNGGYVTRGGRMLEEEAYQKLWDLLDTIPSLDHPGRSVRADILAFNAAVKTEAKARLIDQNHQIMDAAAYGFNNRDRIELTRLLAAPEYWLKDRRIDTLFSAHFFETNFWQMWRTTFAFQNWHSAVELKRYFLRFIQEFPRIHTLSGVRRTRYNQYDAIVRPIEAWLQGQGVILERGTRVTDIGFDLKNPHHRRATAILVATPSGPREIPLGAGDLVMVTLGSITADAGFGGNDTVPPLIRDRVDGGWALWETLSAKAPDFGRPERFFGPIDENKWESFTLTMHGDRLLRRIVEFSGNAPGTGALMTFPHAPWLLSIVVPHQPHFPNLPKDTYTLWGYGLFVDAKGKTIDKTMAECTGHEILRELVHCLGFDDELTAIIAETDVVSVMLPYASALFSPRSPGDRPLVIPNGAQNFAFLGEFVELPEDTVFTVEYSVHTAMQAVYRLCRLGREIPPLYHGLGEPQIWLDSLEAAFH